MNQLKQGCKQSFDFVSAISSQFNQLEDFLHSSPCLHVGKCTIAFKDLFTFTLTWDGSCWNHRLFFKLNDLDFLYFLGFQNQEKLNNSEPKTNVFQGKSHKICLMSLG